MRQLSVISGSQTSDNVFFGCHGPIFARIRCANASWKGLDRCVEIGVAKEGNRLTCGCQAFRVADLLRWWGHHTMKRGTKHIIAPTCQQITRVYDDSSWLNIVVSASLKIMPWNLNIR